MNQSAKPNKSTPELRKDENKIVSAEWKEPLPPPATLAAFDEVIENGAERIMRMTELEQSHRHTIDREVVKVEANTISRGHWLGFLVSLCAMGGAIWTALAGVHWSVSVA